MTASFGSLKTKTFRSKHESIERCLFLTTKPYPNLVSPLKVVPAIGDIKKICKKESSEVLAKLPKTIQGVHITAQRRAKKRRREEVSIEKL